MKLTTPKKILIVVIVALVALAGVSLGLNAIKPFGGKYERVPVVRVEGELKVAKLFCRGAECKWLWAIQVDEAEIMRAENYITIAPPENGEMLDLEISDSKANLHVNSVPISDYSTGDVTVFEYELLGDVQSVIVYYTEEIGSSGLPELYGAVY